LPTNEHLFKAMEFKEVEEKAREVLSRYEFLRPEFNQKLHNVKETVTRKYPPLEIRLGEMTPDGEIIYKE